MLITAGRLLPGPAGESVRDAAVLVRDGTIVAAGPADQVIPMAGASERRQDFPGATILPGLINGHVHLSLDASADPAAGLLNADLDELAEAMVERARQLLYCGVTTVRDLGDRDAGAIATRAAIAAGRLPGPRILAAGAPLTPAGGHCWFFGGEVRDEREMRRMVRRNADAGADVIKVMASGGHITAGGAEMWESQFSVEELSVIVAEATRLGLPVAAHAHGTESIAAAVAAGVRTIEHCTWMINATELDQCEAVAREMADRGIAACCTTGNRDWRVMLEREGERATRRAFGRFTWLNSLGVPLIVGTDAGVSGAVFDDFVGTLELYEWLGFSRPRTIELATVESARGLGLSDRTGRVAAGLSADLLVVDGDPYADLRALRDIRMVVVAGRPQVLRLIQNEPGTSPRGA